MVNVAYSFTPVFFVDKAPGVNLIGYAEVIRDFESRSELALIESE